MTIGAALVLLAVTWFLVLFMVLPIRLQTQGEAGDVVPGTHASAPENPQMKKKFLIVTLVSIPIWIISVFVISSGMIDLEQLAIYKR